jgi:ABC-type sugar transport system substrate-binding protein
MSDLNYTINGRVAKGSLRETFSASGVTTSMATAGVASVTLELGTSTSSVSTANLGAVGVCFARSLATETTHTVSFGRVSGTSLYETVRLKAGEAALMRLAPGDYAAKAAVEGSRLVLTIYED